ncbi:Uncharacterized protein Fot_14681 [Forsythia ovata]|uniref:Uncharacterized protein n=1 Tax=Forsythia ovata TaxID=205694 RepID=A0ABD1W9I8_9LAMI
MASSCSASKSKCGSRKRNNTSIVKRNRCHNKARTKLVKDKYNILVLEGENSNVTIHRDQTNHVTISISNDVPINVAVDMSVCKSDQVVVHTASASKQAHISTESITPPRDTKGNNKVVEDSSEIKLDDGILLTEDDMKINDKTATGEVLESRKADDTVDHTKKEVYPISCGMQ